jgi:hypothetical protein
MYGTTIREIARINPDIKNVNSIRPGQVFDIPGKAYPMLAPEPQPFVDRVPSAEMDSVESTTTPPEDLALMLGGGGLGVLKGLGAAGIANMVPKGAAALARRMPPPQFAAGVPSNAVKGAVHHPGAPASMSNVGPLRNNGQGDMIAKMAMMKQKMQQPLTQGGQMPQGRMPPMNGPQRGMPPMGPPQGTGQTLRDGARMPSFGAGTRAPQPFNPLQQAAQQMQGPSPRNNMLAEMISASRKEPTLADLQTMGTNHPGAPFQDLLRRVGYNRP